MSSLLILPSTSATLKDDKVFINEKFVEGMKRYSEMWEGPVSCILATRPNAVPFSKAYDLNRLPFKTILTSEKFALGSHDLRKYDIVLCSGDNSENLRLVDIHKEGNQKIVFIIEYILESRSQILFLHKKKSAVKKLYSFAWMVRKERLRRRAFRLASGIQANGYPAMSSYSKINRNTLLYLDSRISHNLLATDAEMDARREWQLSGRRLRIIHSGRLEPLKGSQDLIPVARRLAKDNIDFELHIYGSGSLEPDIRSDIFKYGLQDRIFLKGIADFETQLVPFARKNADVYLSCHRQSDPSCTYLESMGCGLAVAGYANRMWSAMCRESGAGWAAPLGKISDLSNVLKLADQNREHLSKACYASRRFAASHSFEIEFQKRVQHLKNIAQE